MTRSTIERLGDAFHAVVFEAWQANGPAIIESVRREHPAAYLKLIASALHFSLSQFSKSVYS